MGCSQGKSIFDKTSTENKELSKFENSWKLSEVPFEKLELYSRRFTSAALNKRISEINRELNSSLPLAVSKSLPNDESFLTFLILLGKGAESDKLRALWLVFDKSLEDKLDQAGASRLLKTIVQVSAAGSLRCYLESHQSVLVQSWEQQLNERTESLSAKLLSHFLGESCELSWTDFISRSKVLPQGRVSNMTDVRTQLEHTQSIPKRFSNPFTTMKLKRLEP